MDLVGALRAAATIAVLAWLPGYVWTRALCPTLGRVERFALSVALSVALLTLATLLLSLVFGLPLGGPMALAVATVVAGGGAVREFRRRSRAQGPAPDRVIVAPHRYALLALALVAVAIAVYHPHWNPVTGATNDFPTHMDDYVHWGRAQAALEQGTVAYAEPFATRGSVAEFEFRSELHERGYHAYLAVLKDASGLDWLVLWKFVPLAAALLLALTVFAIAERWDAGAEAALWLAVIPTTLRFLGPGFMVPIAFSLPILAAGIFALVYLRGWPRLGFLLVLLAALWPIHTMGALALSLLVATDAALRARRDLVGAILQGAVVALPILIVWPYIEGFLGSRLGPQDLPVAMADVRLFGRPVLLCAALGCAILVGSRATTRAGTTLATLFVAFAWLAIARMVSRSDVLGIYDRSLMVLYLLAAIFAGVGVAWTRRRLAHVAAPHLGPSAVAVIILLVLTGQGAAVATTLVPQMEQPYYRVLSASQHQAYAEAAAELNETYRVALVDGISSMAFSTMTGRPLSFTFYPGSDGMPPDVLAFFQDGARDTAFVVERGVTIVVTEGHVENPDLRPIADGVYLLREDYAARIAAAQRAQETD